MTAPLPHLLMPLRAKSSYQAQQRFLVQGCAVQEDAHFVSVYNNALASSTYQKVLVKQDGSIVAHVTLPAAWWLGERHQCADVSFLPGYTLQVLHLPGCEGGPNVWWQRLREACPRFPAIYGDLMLARSNENLGWEVPQLARHVARFWK